MEQENSKESGYECSLCCIDRNAWIGRINIIPTIIIGNMEMELPAIHIMNKFIGNCFSGPSAMSHDFYNNRSVQRSSQLPNILNMSPFDDKIMYGSQNQNHNNNNNNDDRLTAFDPGQPG